MTIKFDFLIHWVWSVVFAILALSGLAMIGAKYGWILSYNLALADYIHRVMAAVYVILTSVVVTHEVIRVFTNDKKRQPWMVIGPHEYQFFTFIATLLFIITGAIIWVCMESNHAALALAMFIHENLTYLVVVSLIWHIYEKSHALLWPKKAKNKAKTASKSRSESAKGASNL
ncbi:MAG: hypothetical protein ACM3PP_08195 [Candidatus Saccharibacteria bacterium]